MIWLDRKQKLRQFPELTRFESEKLALQALRLAERGAMRDYRVWVAMLVYGIVMINLKLVLQQYGIGQGLAGGVVAGLCGVGIAWIGGFLTHKKKERSLRAQLRALGVPICIRCGYDLRGQIEPRCPECGSSFSPLHAPGPHAQVEPVQSTRDSLDRQLQHPG